MNDHEEEEGRKEKIEERGDDVVKKHSDDNYNTKNEKYVAVTSFMVPPYPAPSPSSPWASRLCRQDSTCGIIGMNRIS